MALRRREALALAGVAVAAAAAGFLAGPKLLQRASGDAGLLDDARFKDLTGASRRLAEWRGKVVLLNFWATWCGPCREEIPMLMASRHKFATSGFEIVGIAIDSAAKVAEYAAQLKINYPILVADAGGLELMRRLGNAVGGLPYTVVLDRDGVPVKRRLGPFEQAELEAMLAGLLQQGNG